MGQLPRRGMRRHLAGRWTGNPRLGARPGRSHARLDRSVAERAAGKRGPRRPRRPPALRDRLAPHPCPSGALRRLAQNHGRGCRDRDALRPRTAPDWCRKAATPALVAGGVPVPAAPQGRAEPEAHEQNPRPRHHRRHHHRTSRRHPASGAGSGGGGAPACSRSASAPRARRRSAAPSPPTPAASRCWPTARCGRWCWGLEVVLPDGQVWNGLRALRKGQHPASTSNSFSLAARARSASSPPLACGCSRRSRPHATALIGVPALARGTRRLPGLARGPAGASLTMCEFIDAPALELGAAHLPRRTAAFHRPRLSAGRAVRSRAGRGRRWPPGNGPLSRLLETGRRRATSSSPSPNANAPS